MKLLQRQVGRLSIASVAPVGEFSARFARTIILSHLLTPSQLGATVALVTILTSCEVIADVGLGLFVMVNIGENRQQAVAAARQIGIARGVLLAAVMAALASPFADFFGAAGHVSSMRWLAIIPLIRCFRNWRVLQVQGEHRYGPEAAAAILSNLVAMLAILPAAAWFHDERAMLVSLIVEAMVYVAVSHLVISQERVTRVDPVVRWAALTYGLPLVVNGIWLVTVSQLDRAVVGNLFGLDTLALYSLVVGLAYVPISVLLQILGKVFMAFILRSQASVAHSRQASLITAWVLFVAAACHALAVGAFLDIVIPLIYGHQYQVDNRLHALLVLMVFPKICRGGLSIIFLTYSQTSALTIANVLSGMGLLIGYFLGSILHNLDGVVLGFLIGEMLSLAAMVFLVRKHVPLASMLLHLGWLVMPTLMAAGGAFAAGGSTLDWRILILVVGTSIIGANVMSVYKHYLKQYL